LKGGEIVHFRHFLISGLLVGAALFLPEDAFAEKNELSGQQNVPKASVQEITSVEKDDKAVQNDVQAKAENAKPLVKKVVVPENAKKTQDRASKQPAQKPLPPDPTKKAAEALQKLPEQAKGNVNSVLKNTEKAVKAPSSKKVAAGQEKKELVKKKSTPIKVVDQPTLPSLPLKNDVNKNSQFTKLVYINEPKGEHSHASKIGKESPSEPLLPQPFNKGKAPSSQEEIPDVSQVMNPKRTSHSGGKSQERVSNGLSTINFLDKWFEWNQFYELQFVQPYLSRYALMNNQWVNAPPAQPPQVAPLLETVNRS
jgi:hypothetical protein